MTLPRQRILLLIVVILVIVGSIAGWTTIKVIAWARELPNRIVIDGDAIADSFSSAVTESYHQALRGGDPEIQIQILNDQFIPAIADSSDATKWIRDEYRDDILALVDSEDAQIADAATELISLLDN